MTQEEEEQKTKESSVNYNERSLKDIIANDKTLFRRAGVYEHHDDEIATQDGCMKLHRTRRHNDEASGTNRHNNAEQPRHATTYKQEQQTWNGSPSQHVQRPPMGSG